MGREFLLVRTLGEPFADINESMFLLCAGSQKIQRSARPKILILLDGKCRITLKSGLDEDLETGDIFILPSSCRHTYSSVTEREDVRVYTFGIYFPVDVLGRSSKQGDPEVKALLEQVLAKPCVIRGGFDLEMRHLVSDFRREYDEKRTAMNIRLRALAFSILVALARKLEQHQSQHISGSRTTGPRTTLFTTNQVKEYMSKAMSAPLTLGKIAWHVKLSEEHLARMFKKETGMTVMDYLRFLRIEAAKTYLLNSNETIETLAKRVGFGSVNPFCRTFKKSTGQTPTEFRLNHAGSRLMV